MGFFFLWWVHDFLLSFFGITKKINQSRQRWNFNEANLFRKQKNLDISELRLSFDFNFE